MKSRFTKQAIRGYDQCIQTNQVKLDALTSEQQETEKKIQLRISYICEYEEKIRTAKLKRHIRIASELLSAGKAGTAKKVLDASEKI